MAVGAVAGREDADRFRAMVADRILEAAAGRPDHERVTYQAAGLGAIDALLFGEQVALAYVNDVSAMDGVVHPRLVRKINR